MKRLTERDEFGNADIIGVDSQELQGDLEGREFNQVTTALNKLAAYEDTGLAPERCAELAKAEQEDRLLELPCKVGETVYEIVPDGFMFPSGRRVQKIIERKFKYSMCDKSNLLYYKEFGKDVFLTREEAEKALKSEV